MKIIKPQIARVYVKIQEYQDGKYVASTALTLYDTTAKNVRKVLVRAVVENNDRGLDDILVRRPKNSNHKSKRKG